jgi:peptidyl-prolyl cis-trans isomerase C
MSTQLSGSTGCGSAGCQCVGTPVDKLIAINGIALDDSHQAVDRDSIHEMAYGELLRQHAVEQGLLPRILGLTAPELTADMRDVIQDMLEREVITPDPADSECRRHYEARKSHFVVGQAVHVRHILFGVTPGVNVHALSLRAEQALLDLTRKDVPVGQFERLASELSNCPSGVRGGDLGWLAPEDCAPELANELFYQTDHRWSMGVHPRLVHTRFGFHIVEVLGRRKGKQLSYAEVSDAIRRQLTTHCRATAMRQYMLMLVGQAQIDGLDLEGANTPLVQ